MSEREGLLPLSLAHKIVCKTIVPLPYHSTPSPQSKRTVHLEPTRQLRDRISWAIRKKEKKRKEKTPELISNVWKEKENHTWLTFFNLAKNFTATKNYKLYSFFNIWLITTVRYLWAGKLKHVLLISQSITFYNRDDKNHIMLFQHYFIWYSLHKKQTEIPHIRVKGWTIQHFSSAKCLNDCKVIEFKRTTDILNCIPDLWLLKDYLYTQTLFTIFHVVLFTMNNVDNNFSIPFQGNYISK